MADADKRQDGQGSPEDKLWTLVVDRALPLAAALLAVVAAVLGISSAVSDDGDGGGDPVVETDDSTEPSESDPVTSSDEGSIPETEPTADPGGQDGCDSPQIWTTPDQLLASGTTVLTVTGSCFEPNIRVRLALSTRDFCISDCYDLRDVLVDDPGSFSAIQVEASIDSFLEMDLATVYVVAYTDDVAWPDATQPLQVTG